MKKLIILLAAMLCCCLGACSEYEVLEDTVETKLVDELAGGTEESAASTETAESKTGDESVGMESGTESAGTSVTAESVPEAVTIYVHVCGEVNHPDVYELPSTSRVYDAVKKAGGFTEEADENYLNLASAVLDGAKIYVPSKEEVASGNITYEGSGSGSVTGQQVLTGNQGTTAPLGAADNQSATGKVNINTATAEELKTLSGIGDARAKDIINYREQNGGFQSIEDIMKVPGIKNALFSKIREDIGV